MQKVVESTKQMLESWMNTQNKFVENWVESTRKFQSTDVSEKTLEKGVELYKEWFESQKSILTEAIDSNTELAASQAPEQLSNMMLQQKEFTMKWIDTMSSMMKNPADLKVWENMNSNPMDAWTKMSQEMFKGMGSFDGMKNMFPNKMLQDAFENLMKTSKSYVSLSDLWKPYHDMVSSNKFDVNEYWKMVSPEKYQEAVKNMLNLVSADRIGQASEQVNKFFNMYKDMFSSLNGTTNWMEKYKEMMPMPLRADFNAMEEYQRTVINKVQKLYDPFAKMIPPSKETEMAEGMMTLQNTLVNYQVKMAQMNAILSTATQKAAEKTIKNLFEMSKAGEKPKQYGDFFMQWVDVLENEMIENFQGDEFSKVQGEILGLQMDIKASMKKYMEYFLSPYPVALNAQFDELSKQVHDLKTKIRKMEKGATATSTVVEAVAEVVEADASDAKKSTTRKTSSK